MKAASAFFDAEKLTYAAVQSFNFLLVFYIRMEAYLPFF